MAYLSGQMSADTYHRAISVKRFRGQQIPAGRHIEDSEASSFLAMVAEDDSPRGQRDLALFALAYSTGARREELSTLTPADVDLRARSVTIRHGKMNRQRVVKFSAWVAEPLAAWMRTRQGAVNPDANTMEALFTKIHPSGVVASDSPRLSRAGIDVVLRRRVAAWVAVDPATRRPFIWHDWRRTVAGRALDSGASVEQVQRHLGHASAVQTLAYVRERDALAKSEAVADMMPSPF
jgi:integrase